MNEKISQIAEKVKTTATNTMTATGKGLTSDTANGVYVSVASLFFGLFGKTVVEHIIKKKEN